VILSLK